MKQRWDDVCRVQDLPQELWSRIGQAPVYAAAKVLTFSRYGLLILAIALGFLAFIFFLVACEAFSRSVGVEVTLTRIAIGFLLGWAAWAVFVQWRREGRLRAECDGAFREHGMRCDARVIHFEIRGIRDESASERFIYFQFERDFIIQEKLDASNPCEAPQEGDVVPVFYLQRDRRLARLATRALTGSSAKRS